MSGPLGRLSVQIALGPVLVIALVSIAMLWRIEQHLHAQAEARFADRVKIAAAQLDDRGKSDVQLRVVSASVLAGQAPFVAALQTTNVSAAVQIASTFMARTTLAQTGATGIRIYGPSGNLLVRAEAPQNMAQRTVPPDVLAAIQTGKPVGGVRLDETLGLSVSGIAPVQTADGRTIAAVETLNSLNRTFARAAANVVETDVAIIAGGRVTASSDEGSPGIDPGSVTDDVRNRAKESPVHLRVGNEDHLSSFVTYRDRNGAVVGDIYVGVERDQIVATATETRDSILRTMVIAVLLAPAAAWIFGWLAMRPLHPLLAAAGRLQQNDLESPVPVSGATELRQLAAAMEDMRLAIRQGRDALQTANRDLAVRISTSDASLSEVTQDLDVMQAVVSQLAGESAGGLLGVAEALTELSWADGGFIALATESGELSTAAIVGLPPGAAAAVLAAIEPRLLETHETGFVIEDTEIDPTTSGRLPAWLIRGLAVAPMMTPDGVAGVICVTSVHPLPMTPQRHELLGSIAHEVTAALERSELADEVEENRRVAEAVLREMADGVIVVDYKTWARSATPPRHACWVSRDRRSSAVLPRSGCPSPTRPSTPCGGACWTAR